jgi:hypothetical protein
MGSKSCILSFWLFNTINIYRVRKNIYYIYYEVSLMKMKVLLVLSMLLLTGFFTSMNATASMKEQQLVYDGWSNDLRITSDSGNSQSPSIAVDSDSNSHIVWADDRTGKFEIFYEKRSAAGYTLIDDTQLTSHASDAKYCIPKMIVGGDACLHIMWLADSSLDTLHYMKIDTEGQIVTNDVFLNVDSRWVCYDFTVAQEGSVSVVYIVFIGPANLSGALLVTPRPTEVFFMKIRDNGADTYHDFKPVVRWIDRGVGVLC